MPLYTVDKIVLATPSSNNCVLYPVVEKISENIRWMPIAFMRNIIVRNIIVNSRPEKNNDSKISS